MKQINNIFKLKLIGMFAVSVCLFFAGCSSEGQTGILTEESSESTSEESSETFVEEKGKIYVHVCGEVKKPGVYTLKADARMNDAVKKAGGLTKKADTLAVNLAASLSDGQQVVIPKKGQKVAAECDTGFGEYQSQESGDSQGKVNINSASKEELMTLSGIGQARADAIIAYRQTNGSFQKIEDIMNVSGIKQAAFSKIKDQITV